MLLFKYVIFYDESILIKIFLVKKKMQEKELYSKMCVVRSIKFVANEAREERVNLNVNEKFSCNLATILARDKEVVAVGLRIFPDKCIVYISKNDNWNRKDV